MNFAACRNQAFLNVCCLAGGKLHQHAHFAFSELE